MEIPVSEMEYLGDGLYAWMDTSNQVWLVAYNGIEISDKVAMDSEVFAALVRFLNRKWEH